MSALDRAALEASPLADLHAIASELSIDGYRRLRRAELIDSIMGGPGQEVSSSPEDAAEAESEIAGRPSSEDGDRPASPEPEEGAGRRRRGRRGGAARRDGREETPTAPQPDRPPVSQAEETIEGVVELLPNGSGFLRVNPPEPSDDDVYISAAQVKRCELISGDRVAGPKRPPRRSERFASLLRVDAINGRPAAEVTGGSRFDDLPAAFPDDRFRLGSDDVTLKAIEWLTPFGRGSRVVVSGAARAGKSETLRRLAGELARHEDLQLSVALAGVRPEEISEWEEGPVAPASAASLAASADAQDHAVELVVDQARRLAARGTHAVVLIDGLDGLHPSSARKAMAAARNIRDGGSLTVIATATAPLGGETTVIALDAGLASSGRFPAVDLVASGTIRPELLVGEAGAEAIVRARAEVLEG